MPPHLLPRAARPGLAGEVDVEIRLRASGGGTEVVIDEDAAAGPGVLLPKPIRGLSFRWRNVETLRRLAYIAERRVSPTRAS